MHFPRSQGRQPSGRATRAHTSCLVRLRPAPRLCTQGYKVLTECSSWSTLCAKTGLNDTGDRAPGFFLTARICSRARKARREQQAGDRVAKKDQVMPDACQTNSAHRRQAVGTGELPVCVGSKTIEHTKAKRYGLASS